MFYGNSQGQGQPSGMAPPTNVAPQMQRQMPRPPMQRPQGMQGGNPQMQRQMMQAQQMRRPPNPTGGRAPMGRGLR